jgi:hypothetical protein
VSARTRLFASAAAFAAWIVLLFLGYAWGGAVHLLLAAALVLYPWRPEPVDSGR